MKCMFCGLPATRFVTTTINGKTTQQYLCESCAKQREYDFYHQTRRATRPVQKEIVCPKCQTKQREFLKTGFLGCAECYKTFANTIENLLPKIQGGNKHVGIVYTGERREETKDEKLKRLRHQLNKASKEMRYADAEKIYRQIKELEV